MPLSTKKTLLVNDVVCTVSRYGETLLRIQLSHVPMTAKLDEVIEIVKHIGIVKRVSRPLIHGYEDHLVHIALVPNGNVDLSEEQKITTRSAKFGGRRTNVQYRCLDEIAFCPVCNVAGHTNGPRCPLAGRCLICNKKGHMKRNCPDRHAQSGRDETIEEEDQGPPPGAEQQPPGKPPAPPPPPADASALQSTGLPSLGGSTWGSFDPGVSEIEMRPSKSPLERDNRSSTRSIVSDGRQARLEKVIRGGKLHAEALREQMKEKKRRDKEAKTKYGSAPGLMMQCVSQSSQDEIPQTDGPTDSPAATSHMSEPSEIEEAADDSSTDDTGTDDGETFNKTWVFKDYGEWKIQEIIDNQHNFFCYECGETGCPNL